MAGYDPNNLTNSASRLQQALKSVPSDQLYKQLRSSPIPASQATVAVQNYNKTQDTTAFNSIVGNYQWIFNSILKAANQGLSQTSITTTNFDYNYIKPLLVSYGYVVSDLPSATVSPSDTTVKYDVIVSWPDSTPIPITGISPTSFIAIQNSFYSVTFVPQGGTSPYTFQITGSLPQGWTVGATENVSSLTIQGTSSVLGGGSLVITVTGPLKQTYTTTVNWTVAQPAQVQSDWNALSGLSSIQNKPTNMFVGTTSLAFPGTSGAIELTGITSIDGNAATVTNGVYTTGSYSNPSWITTLAGSKITGNIAGTSVSAEQLSTARNINGVSFDGTTNISIPSLVKNSSTVTLNDGVLTFNGGQGARIDGAFGANGNGIQIQGSTTNLDGPGIIHLLSDYNGLYNEITVNTGAIGIRAATSDGLGGSTTPSAGITVTNTLITVNGTTTMNGLVQFIGGTSGLTKSSVGLGNVTNESKATMFTDSSLTGTTGIVTANITTANITQGTLTTVNNTATSLVNKQYVDSRAFFALAVGIY